MTPAEIERVATSHGIEFQPHVSPRAAEIRAAIDHALSLRVLMFNNYTGAYEAYPHALTRLAELLVEPPK